jgi:hypothetical protein
MAVDRWENEGGFVCGTVPARPLQAKNSSSTTDEVDALDSQVSRVARALASDYSEGRTGIRYNTFQHRSRVLRQMRARLEAMGTRGAASIALGAIAMTFHSEPDEATLTDLMAGYGIARVPTTEFHYKQYRYARLDDALAQARHDEEQPSSPTATRWRTAWPFT